MIAVLAPMLLFVILAIVTLGISFYCVDIVIRLIGRGLLGQPAQAPEPVRVLTESRAVNRRLRAINA